MQKNLNIQVLPEVDGQEELLKSKVAQILKIRESDITHIQKRKRSIDARQKQVKINLYLDVFVNEKFVEEKIQLPEFKNVTSAEEIIIVGAGPAGLFAALKCLEIGQKPIILERGKDVRSRIQDLKAINVRHEVNEDSNYCFGEGGAGTYSDGKLYTRSKKRGDVTGILELLVGFGASRDILVEAHPHIGTNKLPRIIAKIRECILAHGGEIHFNTRVTDFILEGDEIKGVQVLSGDKFISKKVILATGHSSRDIFELLHQKGIEIEAKPLAIGVRVEHSQQLIDSIQYSCDVRSEYLPPSPYSIVKQIDGRGVHSFCMCPGGVIAACATKPGEVVTNGWSGSQRSRPTANSGIVVQLSESDVKEYGKNSPFAFLEFQKAIEKRAWEAGGRTQRVPAQRLEDFVNGKISSNLPKTSYTPGITSVEMGEVLPKFMYQALQEGFKEFNKSMKGYLTNEAVVHAPESRTSSPIRIPRDPKTLHHIRVKGLFPCGEGAGYAGGIVSAAIDGEKCAMAAYDYKATKNHYPG